MKLNPYADRPKVQMPPMTPWEHLLVWTTVALFALMFGALYNAWPDLPARIATHFDISGKPDGWGSKNTLLILPGVALFTGILMLVTSRFPQYCNYPVNITQENAVRVYRLGRELLFVICVQTSFLFWWIQREILTGALGGEPKFSPLWLFLIIGILMLTSIAYMIRMAAIK